jgi:glycosyltransferase 2 family protein
LASRIRVIVQYILILAVTAFLLWFSLKAIHVEEGENKWDYIVKTWQSANAYWLLLMLIFVLISHLIRAERWRMLLRSASHQTTFYHGFLSLMIGYLVNLVIPRGGEVSRCYNLYRLDKVPVEISFGTVVVERIVDLICLVIVLLLAFAIESDKLLSFISTLPIQRIGGGKFAAVILVLVFLLLMAGVLYWIIIRNNSFRSRIEIVWHGFRKGLLSVAKLKNKGLFLVYTIAIWALYFLMSYAVIQAFDETSHLGFSATLTLFAIGTIAMAAPLPGGAGSYHVLLPAGLVLLYQVPQAYAVAFTFVFHAWQTIIMIVGGVVSLILTSIRVKKE